MNPKLDAFDEACAALRPHYAECLRRRALFDRHVNALDGVWLKWCRSKDGPEPLRTEDDDVTSMLRAACAVANRVYCKLVHDKLLVQYDCAKSTVLECEKALKFWHTRIMETLAPQLQALLDKPMRARFASDYPECIQIIVFGDVDRGSMAKCGDLLDSISTGTIRLCANIVEDAGEMIALCDAGDFDAAWERSWLHCIATVRHENVVTETNEAGA